MPWFQALPIIGSAIALSIMVFTQPASASRPMAFTLLVGALMLVSIGFAVKDVVEAVFIAAWLSSS
jgi:bifunctional DNase/RNase